MKKTLFLFAIFLSFETLFAADPAIKISGGSQYPLIHVGAGKHTLNISYDTGEYAGAFLEITLKPFGKDHLCVYKATRKITARIGEVFFEVDFPSLGLYDYHVMLSGKSAGSVLARCSKSVAIIPAGVEKIEDIGVCTHFAQGKGDVPYSLELISRAGFSSIRDEIYWGEVEREKDVFVFTPKYDDYIAAAHEAGIEPLILLGYGNPKGEPTVERGFPVDDAGRQRMVRYVCELVGRYGDKVPYWELWNEPSPDNGIYPVNVYFPLLREVYTAIKKMRPAAEVISSGGSPNHVDGAFIRPILDAGGADYMDGFAMHTYVAPYTPDKGYQTRGCHYFSHAAVPTMWTEYGNISERYSKRKELGAWVTEAGWHIAENLPWNGNADTVNIDDMRQAAYATRLFLLSRRYGTVRKTYLYDFQNDGDNPAEREDNFGIITTDFAPKAGYQAVAVMSAIVGNRPFSQALTESDTVKVYAYGEDKERVVAVWSVNSYNAPLSCRREGSVELKLGAWKVTHIDWQGKETVFRSRNGIFSIPVSENPGYVIFR